MFLFFFLLIQNSIQLGRQCKTEILRSFGLHSRIVPNRNNPLCPTVGLNCCTKHDQLKLHKAWSEHTKVNLDNYYTNSLETFKNYIEKVIYRKEDFVMKELIEKFKKQIPTPSDELITHLKKIQKIWDKKNRKYYVDIGRPLLIGYKNVYKHTKKLRQSFLCGLCNWHNHDYISPETYTINYDIKFCKKMVKTHIQVWADKYTEFIKLGLLLDEFVYLISNYRIIKSQSDRAAFHKYSILIKKCEKDQSDRSSCDPLCKEFNINKFTYIIDGEPDFLKNFVKEYGKIHEKLTSEKKHKLLFEHRRNNYMTFSFDKFKKDTILQEKFLEVKKKKKVKKRGINPLEGLKIKATKSFIEKVHPTNTVQVETLDDQVNTFTLYRMIEQPIDISQYSIAIQSGWGYNGYKDGKQMNLDEGVEKFVALLHSGGKNPNALSEIIEPSVEKIVKDLQIMDIANFVNDDSLTFRKMVSASKLADKLKKMRADHEKKKAEKKKKEVNEVERKERLLSNGVDVLGVGLVMLLAVF